MRARLHVRGHRFGFFREGTHDLCDPRSDAATAASTCDALDRLAAALRSLGVGACGRSNWRKTWTPPSGSFTCDARPGAASARTTDGLTGLASASDVAGAPRDRHVCDSATRRFAPAPRPGVLSGQSPPAAATGVARRRPRARRRGARRPVRGRRVVLGGAACARGARVTAVEGDRVAAADLGVNAAARGGGHRRAPGGRGVHCRRAAVQARRHRDRRSAEDRHVARGARRRAAPAAARGSSTCRATSRRSRATRAHRRRRLRDRARRRVRPVPEHAARRNRRDVRSP